MVSRRQRLRYIDSSGTEQVIGEIAGPGDEKGLSRGQVYHRAREYDKTVARGDVTLKENLPQDNTEFQGDVPEIFFETYDPSTDSWTTRFRGFLINGGLIDRNNEVKALLFDMVKYHGGEEVSVNISSLTTNVDIMKDAVSNLDVVIDHPTETDVQNNSDQDGFVEYDGYTKRGARKEIIREQTRVTGWALKPTGSQDGNGNWIWRYEPVGYGGTVDTIKDKSVSPSVEGSIGIIREWGFSRKKNIINKVELINTEDDGSQVVGSYSAASEASPNSVDKYGERYENFQVGFLSSSKANELAEKIVNRNKNPKEGGNLKAQPRYEGNEANNSFEIRSEQKGIDGVFTCQQQINHYPERSTDFTFTFERQSEAEAALAENLRQERRKLYPQNSQDVGNQGVTTGQALSNTSKTGGVGDPNDRNDNTSNVSKFGGVSDGFIQMDQLEAHSQLGQTLDDGTVYNINDTGFNATIQSEPAFIKVLINDPDGLYGTRFYVRIWLHFDDGGRSQVFRGEYATFDGEVEVNHPLDQTLLQAEGDNEVGIDELEYEIIQFSGNQKTVDISINLFGMEKHSHGDTIGTSNGDMGLTDDIGTNDNYHGGGSGDDQHGGSTDSKNINVTVEKKTDRS